MSWYRAGGCIAAGMVLGVAFLAVTAAALIEFVGFGG